MHNKIALPDGVGLRIARESDKVFLDRLFQSTHDFIYQADAEKEYLDLVVDQQRYLQTEGYGQQFPNACTMIVEKQQESIGKVIMDFGSNMVHILDLALIPAARNKGYGKAVLQALQYVATQQLLPVGLSVETYNHLAKKLYLSLGFQVVEQTPTHEFMLWYPQPVTQRVFTG